MYFTVANSVLKKEQKVYDVPLVVKPLHDMTETANTQEVSLQCFSFLHLGFVCPGVWIWNHQILVWCSRAKICHVHICLFLD